MLFTGKITHITIYITEFTWYETEVNDFRETHSSADILFGPVVSTKMRG